MRRSSAIAQNLVENGKADVNAFNGEVKQNQIEFININKSKTLPILKCLG